MRSPPGKRAGTLLQLVTQNVDGLHQRAGSRAVIDLHGRLDVVVCLGCGERTSRDRAGDHRCRQCVLAG